MRLSGEIATRDLDLVASCGHIIDSMGASSITVGASALLAPSAQEETKFHLSLASYSPNCEPAVDKISNVLLALLKTGRRASNVLPCISTILGSEFYSIGR